jgi:MSHA biogenesis protein MshQ
VAAAPACTGLFGRFRPQYLKTELDQPNAWAYSGQPFRVKVTGFSEGGTKTKNYNVADGFHQDITFSAWGVPPDPVAANPAAGIVAPSPLPKASLSDTKESDGTFAEGAVVGSPSYTFDSSKLPVKPTKIYVRAISEDATSEGHGEAIIEIRTGRLRMSNAFGSVSRTLPVPVRVEYWTGNSWLRNTQDSSTILSSSAIALTPSAAVDKVAVIEPQITMANGAATFTLKAPTRNTNQNGVGFVDIAANLGEDVQDKSCLVAKPVTVGAKVAWLRSLNGSCNSNWTQDPTARANFGVTTPENNATIHVRESFN